MNGSGISNGERCSRSNSFGLGTGTGSSGTGSCASIIADQASINNHCVGGGSLYDQEAEDDMVATERELAEDAQWKRIQQNTFTRWANEHLKTVNKNIGNLETDLSDGLRLITLIEVLSGERIPKHNKKPTFRSQKLENVSVALKFLEDVPIKIVNIGKYIFLIVSLTTVVFAHLHTLFYQFRRKIKNHNYHATIKLVNHPKTTLVPHFDTSSHHPTGHYFNKLC